MSELQALTPSSNCLPQKPFRSLKYQLLKSSVGMEYHSRQQSNNSAIPGKRSCKEMQSSVSRSRYQSRIRALWTYISPSQGRIQKISRGGGEGLPIKGPANLTYPHFQKHPGFRPLFSQKGPFQTFKNISSFLKFYQKAKGAPTTSLVFVLSLEDLKRP